MADDNVTITIEFESDDRQLKRTFKNVEATAKREGNKTGKEYGDSFRKSASRGFKSIAGVAASVGGAVLAALGTREVIQAAARQEEAINNLNASLSRIGEFSQQTSQDLQNFASQLQNVTRFGDEAVLEQLSFAQGLGATAEQSKAVVSAAADLAAALNIDLNSATRNVARTLGGFAGELGEVIPELKNLSAEQLRAGAAIDLLGAKFRGLAQAQIRTFSGAIDQARNAFGDFLEGIGSFITSSPSLIGLVRGLSQVFLGLSSSLKESAAGTDIFQAAILETINLVRTFGPSVFTAFTAASRGFKVFIDSVVQGGNILTSILGTIGEGVGRLAKAFGIDGDLAQGLIDFGETSRSVAEEGAAELSTSLKSLGEPIDTTGLIASLDTIEQAVVTTNANITAANGGIAPTSDNGEAANPVAAAQEASVTLGGLFSQLGAGFAATENQIKTGLTGIAKAAIQVGQAAKRGIGQGLGAGFAAFGSALASGENALDAFGKAFLGALGGLMIQQGTAFILQGLGFQLIPGLQGNGAALVGVGAALATFGGVLSAIGGGGGAVAAGGVGGGVGAAGGGGDAGDDSGVLTNQEEETQQRSASVNLTVNGDIFDTEETGVRLTKILSESFETDSGVLVNGAIA